MTAQVIPLPRYYGPKRRPKRGRPPKNQPRATVLFRQFGKRQAASGENPEQSAYSLYCEASQLDESASKADVDKALSMYEKAIELDPGLAIAYTNLGNIHFRRHDSAKARHFYDKALSLDSNQPEALYNLGYLELEGGFAMAAIRLFRRALSADPGFSDAWFNLAMALEQIGSPATLQWQRYLSLEPNNPHWSEIARRHLG